MAWVLRLWGTYEIWFRDIFRDGIVPRGREVDNEQYSDGQGRCLQQSGH
jgi:hypothetical protein